MESLFDGEMDSPLEHFSKKIRKKLNFSMTSETENEPEKEKELSPPPTKRHRISTVKQKTRTGSLMEATLVEKQPVQALKSVYDDLSNYPKLHAVSIQHVNYVYSQVEMGQKKLKDRVSYRTIYNDMKNLNFCWKLCTVSILSKLVYSTKHDADLTMILKLLARRMHDYLRMETHDSQNVLKSYQKTFVEIKVFHAFKPLTTRYDEPAYVIKVWGKNKEGKWRILARIILGSIGLHKTESVSQVKADPDFSYYPFILTNNDSMIHRKIYEFLDVRHGGRVRYIKFSPQDMWRIVTCLVVFASRLKANHAVFRLSLSFGDAVEVKKLDVRLPKEMCLTILNRFQAMGTSSEMLTSELVAEIRDLAWIAYQKQFNEEWDSDKISIEKCTVRQCQVTRHGVLEFTNPNELISFLYFYGRYHTCTHVHRVLGVNFDDTMQSIRPTGSQEMDDGEPED